MLKEDLKWRFFSKVNISSKPGGCWIWTGAKGRRGYGRFWTEHRKSIAAHRFSYETFVGSIPMGLFVCHHCDNPPCVRPDHLFIGTRSDNIQDSIKKGRFSSGENHVMCKLSDNQVAEIRELRSQGMIITKLATRFQVSKSLIGLIVLGKYRKALEAMDRK